MSENMNILGGHVNTQIQKDVPVLTVDLITILVMNDITNIQSLVGHVEK